MPRWFYAQAAGVLPGVDVTMTPGTGTNGYKHCKLVLNAGGKPDHRLLEQLDFVLRGHRLHRQLWANNGNLTATRRRAAAAAGILRFTIGITNTSGSFNGKVGGVGVLQRLQWQYGNRGHHREPTQLHITKTWNRHAVVFRSEHILRHDKLSARALCLSPARMRRRLSRV